MKAERPALFLLLLLLATAGSAVAQTDLSADPGFVDFSHQVFFSDDDLEIHVSVKDPMIRLVAEATRENDPALAEVLGQLKAVEVFVYQVADGRDEEVRQEIARQARELTGGGWSEAITIRLRNARGHVFLRLPKDKPVGLAALYFDENASEAVFVNIVGTLDPLEIGRLAAQFNLDVLSEAVQDQMPKKKEP